MPCSLCKKCGHNKATCPLNPKKRLTKAQTKVKAEAEKRSKELAWNKPKALGEVVPIGNGLDFTTPEAVAAVSTAPTTTKKKKGWRAGVGGGTTYGPNRKDEDPLMWCVGFCRPTKKTSAPTRRMWSVATDIF